MKTTTYLKLWWSAIRSCGPVALSSDHKGIGQSGKEEYYCTIPQDDKHPQGSSEGEVY